jgi:hypothetical protein
MRVRFELFFLLLPLSCVYDPPLKGKTLSVHNQTEKQFLVIDSLTGNYFKLYDTALVNDRKNIARQGNYLSEYGDYESFYSNRELDIVKAKRLNTLTLFFVEQTNLRNSPGNALTRHLYRSFKINVDTLKKYQLNHVFLSEDTIIFEHGYDYLTIRKN